METVLNGEQYQQYLIPISFSEGLDVYFLVGVIYIISSVNNGGKSKTSKNHEYPQPRREDLFAGLAGGQTFSKLDLAQAYLQMEVEPESRKYLTINTPKGLFQYKTCVWDRVGTSHFPTYYRVNTPTNSRSSRLPRRYLF